MTVVDRAPTRALACPSPRRRAPGVAVSRRERALRRAVVASWRAYAASTGARRRARRAHPPRKRSSDDRHRSSVIGHRSSVIGCQSGLVARLMMWLHMGIFHGHPTTHRDPTADTRRPSSHARGRERSIARKNLARPMRATTPTPTPTRWVVATAQRDGATRRGRRERAWWRANATRRDRSSGRVPTVFVHHHHHRRGTGGRASHTDVAHRRHQGDARARIASHPSHPSIHRFDACVTSTRREVRARARTCECVKKVARAARIARGAMRARWCRNRRRFVDVAVPAMCRRRRGIHSRDARDVVRACACAMGGRDDEPVYDAAFARGRRVDVADARKAHGTARHGAARGCARPQTPTSAVV